MDFFIDNLEIHLNVPFVSQTGEVECVLASTLMIHQKYYGVNSGVSQNHIANYYANEVGVPYYSASYGIQSQVLRHYAPALTWVSHLASSNEPYNMEFMSAQAHSIWDNRPVYALINGGLHAGVVNGGYIDRIGDIEPQHRWTYVLVHDPLEYPDVYYEAGDWVETNCPHFSTCKQIIHNQYPPLADDHLLDYGNEFEVSGYQGPGGGDWPPGWPPAY